MCKEECSWDSIADFWIVTGWVFYNIIFFLQSQQASDIKQLELHSEAGKVRDDPWLENPDLGFELPA